ncbi:MAG: FG-GAP-like repeat-containing protein [Salinibacter sp.]
MTRIAATLFRALTPAGSTSISEVRPDALGRTTLMAVLLVGGLLATPAAAQEFIVGGQSLGDGHTEAVATGDLDGDGDTDLVLGNGSPFEIDSPNTVWLNDGTGTFTDTGQSLGTTDTQDLALVDVNGDQDLDLIASNGTSDNEFGGAPNKVWLNDGTGTFTDSGQELGNFDTGGIAIADVDGDSDQDVVAGREGSSDSNYVWFNDGSGTFSGGDQFIGDGLTNDVALADVDGDGDPDLLAGNNQGLSGSRNVLWLNDGDGTFTESSQTFEFTSTYAVVFADLNGDGAPDIVDGVRGSASGNEAWMNDGNGDFTKAQSFGGVAYTVSLAVGDLDGDGDPDLVEGNSTFSAGQPNRVWTNDNGTFTNTGQSLGEGETYGLATADTDGDGDTDFVAGNGGGSSDGAPSRVWLNQSGGGNQPPTAAADTFSTPAGQTLTVGPPGVLGNDTDPDGDALAASLVSGVANGSLTLGANGSVEYTPDTGFAGTDQFAYEATDGSAADTATATIDVQADSTVRTIPLADGWSLVAVPLQTEAPSFGAVLSPCFSGFFFEPGVGYQPVADGDPLPPGQGLFANCSGGSVEVTGTRVDTPTVAVESGWNLVGPFADPVAAGSVGSTPEGIVQTPFFGFAGGYQAADTLRPGRGYWVKATESGTLDLSGGAGNAAASVATARPQSGSGAQPRVRLRWTDATGRSATLRLAAEASGPERARHALPPVPPSGMFDVRFEGGRSLAAGPGLHAVETQGLRPPVTVEWVGAGEGRSVRLRQEGTEARLTPASPSVTLSTAGDIAVGLEAGPTTFRLERPAPNPASERAALEYALPEPTEVNIGLYDVLGRRVAQVVDARKTTGQHEAELRTASLPSGTYFVRMQAGSVTKTRRLSVVH